MRAEQKNKGTKITSDELIALLNKWQGSASKIQLMITIPELTTILTVVVERIEYPTITLTLGFAASIVVHLSGCLLERFEGDNSVGTAIRAAWPSLNGREIVLLPRGTSRDKELQTVSSFDARSNYQRDGSRLRGSPSGVRLANKLRQ
jgi:hypothetical protein